TGVFTAGAGTPGVDLTGGDIKITDATGTSIHVAFTVTAGLQLQPVSETVHHSSTHTYTAVGGVPPYSFSSSITSGGLVTPGATSANYVAGAGTVGTPYTDTITVADSNPNHQQSS